MLCSPQNWYVEASAPNVMVFGDGALRRQLVLDEAIVVEPWSDGISALVREDSRQLSPSHDYVRTQQEGECGKAGEGGLTRNRPC